MLHHISPIREEAALRDPILTAGAESEPLDHAPKAHSQNGKEQAVLARSIHCRHLESSYDLRLRLCSLELCRHDAEPGRRREVTHLEPILGIGDHRPPVRPFPHVAVNGLKTSKHPIATRTSFGNVFNPASRFFSSELSGEAIFTRAPFMNAPCNESRPKAPSIRPETLHPKPET